MRYVSDSSLAKLFRVGTILCLTRRYISEYSTRTMSTEQSTEQTPDVKALRRVKPHSSLAAWRKAQGWTQHEAAAYLGISQSYYYKLEAKVQNPRKGILKRITERTGVPVDELMGIAA